MKNVRSWVLVLTGVIVGVCGVAMLPNALAHTPDTLSGPTYCHIQQVSIPPLHMNKGLSEPAIVIPAGFWSEGWNSHYVGSKYVLVGMICTNQDSTPVK